jgi:hypothetical protein
LEDQIYGSARRLRLACLVPRLLDQRHEHRRVQQRDSGSNNNNAFCVHVNVQ